MVRVLACCLLALAACYEPTLASCTVRCAEAADCAPGQTCRDDGWCTAPGMTAACAPATGGDLVPVSGIVVGVEVDAPATPIDAPPPPPPDAPSVDAPPACAPGCPGRCEDGVCVIECIGEKACEDGVTCPAQGGCTVLCIGEKACKDGVRCGTGRCTVTCTGEKACEKGVDCEDACACSATCSGDKACDDGSECPQSQCELGDGCHASGACDAC